jgi:translation initiation factor IF-2
VAASPKSVGSSTPRGVASATASAAQAGPAAGARPRPDAGAGTASREPHDDRAVAAAAGTVSGAPGVSGVSGSPPVPRTAPDGAANGSAERAAVPDGAVANGTAAGPATPDTEARRLPPVAPSPASRPGPEPDLARPDSRPQGSPGVPGASRVPGPPRSPVTPADFRSPGTAQGGQGRSSAPRPGAPGAPHGGAPRRPHGPSRPEWSGRPGWQAVRAEDPGTWCSPAGCAQVRWIRSAPGCSASRPEAGQ